MTSRATVIQARAEPPMSSIQPKPFLDVRDEGVRPWAAGGLRLPAQFHYRGDEADASRIENQKLPE